MYIFANLIRLAPNIGESGSWVLDEQNYGVYGHLVASDVLREAYVVPFDKILLDIKNHLGAVSVRLPSRNDISRRTEGKYPIPRASSPQAGIAFSDSGYSSVNGTPPFILESLPPPSDLLFCAHVDTVPNDPVPNDPVRRRFKDRIDRIKMILAGSRHPARK